MAVYLGRLTVMDGTSLSLVWPAAGVATLWFAVQRRAGTMAFDLAALSLSTVVINAVTGASIPLAVCFVGANVVQVLVFHLLFGRWVPTAWGAGGQTPLTGMAQLARLMAASILATATGALIGPTAVWLFTGNWSPLATLVWMTRNSASVILVMAVGLRVGSLINAAGQDRASAGMEAGQFQPRLPFMHMSPLRSLELSGAVLTSVAVYSLVFGESRLPLAFLPIAVTVWVALRFDTTIVVVHDLIAGIAAVLFTLSGHGPFSTIVDHATEAIVVQAFVGLLAVIGLALALSRDEREVLMSRVRHDARQAEHAAHRMQVLASASRSLAAADDARQAICEAAREIAVADGAYLMELDAEGNLHSTATAGFQMPALTVPATEATVTSRVLRSREREFISDIVGHPEVSQRVVELTGGRSAAWHPIFARDGRAIGVVCLAFRTWIERLPPHVPEMLDTLANEAAAAIERSELLNRLEQAAGRDALTGTANRRRWDEVAAQEIARAERTGQPLTFALIDLDHFKRYNDAHGHLGGDVLLGEFAGAAQDCLREVDTLARWGGEEFAIALPGCTAADARNVADRIRASVPQGQTCTIGIAQWQSGQSVANILRCADEALYFGKKAGRDITVLYSPVPAHLGASL